MKRFTDTLKWSDPWYRKLSGTSKLLWIYLLDNCNSIGVVELDLGLASTDLGQPVEKKHLAELGDRVQALEGDRIFIPKFIHFQYGELSTACAPHRNILKLIAAHGLTRSSLLYHYPNATHIQRVPEPLRKGKEKEKDQDQEKEKEKDADIYHHESRTALHWLNEKSGRHYRETDANLGFISARLREKGVDIEGVKRMIERQCVRWMNTEYSDYLRPETLFNKTKFDGYYSAKGEPVNGQHFDPVPFVSDEPEPDLMAFTKAKWAREAQEAQQ